MASDTSSVPRNRILTDWPMKALMLQRALAIDPGIAQAYAYLAVVGCAEYANGWNDRMAPDAMRKSRL